MTIFLLKPIILYDKIVFNIEINYVISNIFQKGEKMSLRLICGKAGTGKSEICLEKIKQEIEQNKKIYIITPEQYSFTAEKKL